MNTSKEIQTEKISRWDQTIAKIALANHLVNREQLAKAFSIAQKERLAGRKPPIEDIFLKNGMVPEGLLNDLGVAAKRKLGKRYGLIALKKGYITQEQLDKALHQQAREFKEKKSCEHICDILVSQDALTADQRDEIRGEQEDVEIASRSQTETPGIEKSEQETEPSDKRSDSAGGGDTAADDVRSHADWPFQIEVSENKLEAAILLTGTVPQDVSVARIRQFLEKETIKYGIVEDEQISIFLENESEPGSSLIVARGKPMVPGVDACITYHFNKDYLSAGKIQEDGDIDYRDRGDIPLVKEGDLIAEKTPAKAGEPGIDIHGHPISVPEPEDTRLVCESGTLLSEDGLKVHAKIDGQPNVTVAGKISVFAEFSVNGDVNYETGNIDFDGNINVKGSVNDGFSVKGGNLSAKEVLGATIHVKGDVIVTGGIMGAHIEAEGNVVAKFIKDANIKAYGHIIAAKEVMDSKVRTSGKFMNQSGKIISSLVTAKQGVEAKDIGTVVSNPCTIKIGGNEHIRKIAQGFERTISTAKKDLEKEQTTYETLISKQKSVHQKIADLTQIQDRAAAAVQQLEKKIDALKKQDKEEELAGAVAKMDGLREKKNECDKKMTGCFNTQETLGKKIEQSLADIESLIEHIENMNAQKKAVINWSKEENGTPVLKATGSIYSSTRIHGEHALTRISETVRNVLVKEVASEDNESDYDMTIVKA